MSEANRYQQAAVEAEVAVEASVPSLLIILLVCMIEKLTFIIGGGGGGGG